jgi:tryptophan 2,3-dioxygenase
MDKEIIRRIEELDKKYAAMGQDLKSYLDGLLVSNYPTYWEYIRLETLLTLQQPKTDFPDELIFIGYHQITELYFKLVLHELEQIAYNGKEVLSSGSNLGWKNELNKGEFIMRLQRINEYFAALTKSFDIMVKGMEKSQFLTFRMALLPSSGFQSAQYRKIEICSTSFIHLVSKESRHLFTEEEHPDIRQMFEYIYWKLGATELSSGKKTLTLTQFERQYSEELIGLAEQYQERNLWMKYCSLSREEQEDPELKQALRQLDINVNVNWPLVHYKSAVRYLQQDTKDIEATGGTNWQKYLPPRFQKRIFYPSLWSEQEKEEWGKGWVHEVLSDSLRQ